VTWEGMTSAALAVAKGPIFGSGLNQRRKYAKWWALDQKIWGKYKLVKNVLFGKKKKK